jgi:hypothetical protein
VQCRWNTGIASVVRKALPQSNRYIHQPWLANHYSRIAESLETAIAIIPIPDSVSFLSSIQEYMASLVVLPVLRPELSDAVALLARTIRSRYFKFTEEDINFLVELFPSLMAMSRAVRTQDGRQMLRDFFGDALGTEMIRYWEEDEH